MSYTYTDYCKSMRSQGKRPVSEEEFNLKKEELRDKADMFRGNAKEARARAKQREGGFLKGLLSFLASMNESMAKQLDKYGK